MERVIERARGIEQDQAPAVDREGEQPARRVRQGEQEAGPRGRQDQPHQVGPGVEGLPEAHGGR